MSNKFDAILGDYRESDAGGGVGTPGGSTTQMQFNDAGAFGGNSAFTFDKTTKELLFFAQQDLSEASFEVQNTAGTNGGAFLLQDTGAYHVAIGTGVLDFNSATNLYQFGSTGAIRGILDFNSVATTNKTFTFPNTTGTVALTTNLSQFASTTSAQLAGVISDETGSGALVFGTSPTLVTPTISATDFTNMNHTHAGATTGGTIAYSALTGLPTLVTAHSALTGLASDDHTQYALLAGRSGGQTLAGSPTTAENMTIRANAADYLTGVVNVENPINLNTTNRTYAATPQAGIRVNGTYTINYAGSKGGAYADDSTLIFLGTSTTFSASLFNATTKVTNDAGTSVGLAPYFVFIGQPQIESNTFDQTQFRQATIAERTSFQTLNGGTLRTTLWQQFVADNLLVGNVKSGAIVLARHGFNALIPTVATGGILHTNIAFSAADQTHATNGARDFNYAWLGGSGLMKHGDDFEVDSSTGAKGIVLHSPDDTRWRLAVSNAGVVSSAEIAFDPFVDMDWYMATDARSANVNGVADTAAVTRWNDKSGNGRDLTLGGGVATPIYETVRASLNSQPAVEFTAASSQSLEMATTSQAAPSILTSVGFTIVAVVDFKTVAAVQRVFGSPATNNLRGMGINATPRWTTVQATTTVGASVPATATKYFMRWYVTNTAHTLFINEVSEVAVATTGQNLNQIVIGAGRNSTPVYANFFDGYMAFFGIYQGDVTTATRWADFKTYMNTTYGFAL